MRAYADENGVEASPATYIVINLEIFDILSQSSNAILFYFDDIIGRVNAIGRLVHLNESSFS